MFDASPRPELLALLAAAKADTADDTPKLVLADWLQEQDHEVDRARGEFLRLTVQFRRADANDHVGQAMTLTRLNALWEHYHGSWLGPLTAAGFQLWNVQPADCGLLYPTIDGTQAVARAARDVAGSEAYAWVEGLHFVRLSPRQFGRFVRSLLLNSLSSLTLSHCLGNATITELADSPRAANLRCLDLFRVRAASEAIAASPHLAGLRELRLRQARVDDAGFKALCDSPHLNELQSLTVTDDALTIHAGRAFADATGLLAVEGLNLAGNRVGPDGTLIMAASENAARLRKLNLAANGIADYGVEAVCNQKHINKLTHLDVSGNLLRDRAALALAAASHLGTLRELNLRGNDITDAGAEALANSPHLTDLRRLDLSGNPMREKAAALLRERFGSRVVLDGPA